MLHQRSRALSFLFAAATLLSAPAASRAAMIHLTLTDADLRYSGEQQAIYDTAATAGGSLDPAEADPLVATLIKVDTTTVASLSPALTPQYLDVAIMGLPTSLSVSSLGEGPQRLSVEGFGIDWFTGEGDYLRLSVSAVDVLLTSGVMFFTSEAVVIAQRLPAGLRLSDTVSVSFTATNPALQLNQPSTVMAIASGAMTISGVLIPEPATAALVGVIGVSALAMGVSRKSAK